MGDIEKLPRWARDHIRTLQRGRDEAHARLERYHDRETPSPFYSIEWEGDGTKFRRVYYQPHSVCCQSGGVKVELIPREDGVEVVFGGGEFGTGLAALAPQASNVLHVIPKPRP
jgi:hypothetical protein